MRTEAQQHSKSKKKPNKQVASSHAPPLHPQTWIGSGGDTRGCRSPSLPGIGLASSGSTTAGRSRAAHRLLLQAEHETYRAHTALIILLLEITVGSKFFTRIPSVLSHEEGYRDTSLAFFVDYLSLLTLSVPGMFSVVGVRDFALRVVKITVYGHYCA